ncbi:hypothetical protein [Streptomyces sp. NPDC093261]|uniref:hypothetical protein n=1 Tax=Streptomyces sp. NPDC093261 TaxID=3366037 RepID=UPI0037FB2DC9
MSHCPHEGVEILDEDWWYCRDCGDAGPYLFPMRRPERLPGLAEDYSEGYGEVLSSRDKRRYYCHCCGNVITIWGRRVPELVPTHYRWGETAAVECQGSRSTEVMEAAP